MKACPQCGNVNDSSVSTCAHCGYNFTTGQHGNQLPPILAEDPNTGRRGRDGGRAVGIAVVVAVLVVFAVAAVILVGVEGKMDRIGRVEFEAEAPVRPSAQSCVKAVGNALERLLRAQAKGKPLQDFLTDFTRFDPSSFEYRTLVRQFSERETQSALATGNVERAIARARREAAQACQVKYGV